MPDEELTKSERQALRIQAPRLGQVREVIEFFEDLENAYNNLYVFDSLVASVESESNGYRYGGSVPKFSLVARGKVDGYLLPQDRLSLNRIQFQSPGFWEFLGALNPLEVLRKWSSDRHERKKDAEYRQVHEAERMRLENEKLKTEVACDRIRLLEQAGVPKDKIREAINQYLVEPLTKLERHQDAGLVEDAEIVDLDERDLHDPS